MNLNEIHPYHIAHDIMRSIRHCTDAVEEVRDIAVTETIHASYVGYFDHCVPRHSNILTIPHAFGRAACYGIEEIIHGLR